MLQEHGVLRPKTDRCATLRSQMSSAFTKQRVAGRQLDTGTVPGRRPQHRSRGRIHLRFARFDHHRSAVILRPQRASRREGVVPASFDELATTRSRFPLILVLVK